MPTQTVLSALTLAVAAVAALLAWQARSERAAMARQAQALTERAEALCAKNAFPGCVAGLETALPFTLGAGDAERLRSHGAALDRARALSLVARDFLPGGSDRFTADALVERLAAEGSPASLQASAALEVCLRRADGALPAARTRAEAALKAGQDSLWLQWQLGALALSEGRVDDALGALERVAKEAPEFAPVFHRLGLAYLSASRREAAIGALQKAVTLSAQPEASLDLARAFLAGEMWAEAQAPLETVLRADGTRVEALRLLALSFFRQQNFARAAELYRKAWGLAPEPRTLLSAAIALHAGGQHAAALETLDTLAPAARGVPEILFLRGRVLTDIGRPADARATYGAYIEVATNVADESERLKAAQAALAALAKSR
jgi:tetratricopeptide (TPR) repeat protein